MRIVLVFTLLLVGLATYGQHPTGFTGTWKPVAFITSLFNWSADNDSIVMTEEVKLGIKDGSYDTTVVNMMLGMMKLMAKTMVHTFRADGRYETVFSAMGDQVSELATYTIDAEKKEILCENKNADGSVSRTKQVFRWNGQFLQLQMQGDWSEYIELKKVE